MSRPQTENEKLRTQIPLTDKELVDWLTEHQIPFERDGAGIPWLSYSTLSQVLQELAVSA
jgi:hypothetical protein